MILYRIINAITGKSYIGITKGSLRQRFANHWHCASRRASRSALHASMRKHGREAFTIEAIGSAADYNALLRMEIAAIALYATASPSGYNVTLGGQGQLGRAPTPETRLLLSERSRAAWSRPELKEMIAAVHREAWSDPAERTRRKDIIRAHWESSGSFREKASKSLLMGREDPETLKKKSESLRKRWADPEFRAMMFAARRPRERLSNGRFGPVRAA